MSQDRIMSIHGLLMHLVLAFHGGNALNGNVKHFVFDIFLYLLKKYSVTSQVTQGHFFKFMLYISSRAIHCGLNMSAMSFGYRDSREGPLRPPPLQRAGVGPGPTECGLYEWITRTASLKVSVFIISCLDAVASAVFWTTVCGTVVP